MLFAMILPAVNQVCEILVVQPRSNDAVEGGRCPQATTTQQPVGRVGDGRQGDRATCTAATIEWHFALTGEAQRNFPVAAQPTEGAVMGEKPVEQALTNVVNHKRVARLTA